MDLRAVTYIPPWMRGFKQLTSSVPRGGSILHMSILEQATVRSATVDEWDEMYPNYICFRNQMTKVCTHK